MSFFLLFLLHVKMPKRLFFFFFSLTNVLSVVKTVTIVNVNSILIILCLLFVKSLNVAIYLCTLCKTYKNSNSEL